MNTNILELTTFNNACDELISGKYILVDIKISNILNIINNDNKLKDIVQECSNSFNYINLFNESIKGSKLELPTNENQIVCIVYNVLYQIKNKYIDLNSFLDDYFVSFDNYDEKLVAFMNILIVPFKQAVGNLFIKKHHIVDSNEYQNNCYNKIKNMIKLISNNIDNYKLDINAKEEFTMLLNSLYSASDKNDKQLVYSLMIAIDYFSKYFKKTRKAYLALEECFV